MQSNAEYKMISVPRNHLVKYSPTQLQTHSGTPHLLACETWGCIWAPLDLKVWRKYNFCLQDTDFSCPFEYKKMHKKIIFLLFLITREWMFPFFFKVSTDLLDTQGQRYIGCSLTFTWMFHVHNNMRQCLQRNHGLFFFFFCSKQDL